MINKIFYLFTFLPLLTAAQKNLFFGELFGGVSRIPDHRAWIYGIEGNLQRNNMMFSARYTQNYYQFIKLEAIPVSVTWLPIVVTEGPHYLDDYALLAGYRKSKDGFSYSFSGGISLVQYAVIFHDENNVEHKQKDQFVGFPMEANIKWFKKEKSKYRVYGLIPVGKATSLGNSIGFKLLGNISKNSYVGICLVWGIGSHQEY